MFVALSFAPYPAAMSTTPDPQNEIQIPLPEVVKFVRQLSHDLRNHLNAAELQSTYLGEIAADPELKEETKRLREMLSAVSASLQRVTTALGAVKLTLMDYRASEFIEDLKSKLTADYPNESAQMNWNVELGDARLEIDPQMLQPALLELFANAFRHDRGEGPISVEARMADDHFVFTLREPKQHFERATEQWGREPLRAITQGHYGLGLHWSRSIMEAHAGQLNARYNASESSLITTVILPRSKNAT